MTNADIIELLENLSTNERFELIHREAVDEAIRKIKVSSKLANTVSLFLKHNCDEDGSTVLGGV